MSKKLILLASVALVVLCGLMLVSGSADAVEPGVEGEPGAEGTTPTPEATGPVPVEGQVNQWTFGGCTYFVDQATIDLQKPVAQLIAYDGATKNVVIPSVLKGLKVTVSGEEKVLDCSIAIGFTKDKFDNNAQVFAGSTVLETLVFEDGAKDSITIPGAIGSGDSYTGAFQGCTNLKSVVFGTPITKVSGGAFNLCNSLSVVTFSDSLVTIDQNAFAYTAIKSLTIPDSVTTLGQSAFQGISAMDTIVLGNGIKTIPSNAFSACGFSSLTIPDSVTSIDRSFEGCRNLNTLDMGCNLERVGNYCFQDSNLRELNIPEKLTVDGYSFANTWGDKIEKVTVSPLNTKYTVDSNLIYNSDMTELLICLPALRLTEYTAPESVTTIGNSIFGCYASTLVTVNLTNVTTLGRMTFQNCSELTTVNGLENVTSIGKMCFKGCSSLMSADVSGASTIGTSCFNSCTGLKTVVLPSELTTIPSNLFYECTSLESVSIPGSVTTIEIKAFYNCKSIPAISLPDSVTTIKDSAFEGCSNLNITELPASLVFIGQYAFKGTAIEEIVVGDCLPVIDVRAYAFWDCPVLKKIEFTKNCNFSNVAVKDYGKIANGSILTDIKFDTDLWRVDFWTSAVFSNDLTTLYMYPQGKTGTFEVKSNLMTLADKAFYGCNLTEVIFNNDRHGQPILVGSNCFGNSKLLEKIVFCDDMTFMNRGSVTDGIGNYTISGCSALQYVSFPNHGLASQAIDGMGTFVDGSNGIKPQNDSLIGYIYVGDDTGHLYKFCPTATSLNPEGEVCNIYADVNIIGDVTVSKNLNLYGSMTLLPGAYVNGESLPGASVDGTLYATNNYIEFNAYEPKTNEYAGIDSFAIRIYNDCGVFGIDGNMGVPFTGSMNEVSRVVGAEVTNFYNNGSGIIVDMASFTDAVPDGKLIVQYSVYTEYQGEKYVDPFKMKALDVAGDTLVKTDVGENMISCSVSYAYGYDGETYFTPASSSVNMLPMGVIEIEAPEDVTVTVSLDGKNVVSGDAVVFGPHAIDIQVVGDVACTLDGKDVTTIESIIYVGQKLVIVKAAVPAP